MKKIALNYKNVLMLVINVSKHAKNVVKASDQLTIHVKNFAKNVLLHVKSVLMLANPA